MSNFLAIATVTSAIQQILREAISEQLPGAEVTTLRLDDLAKAGGQAGINVYLFQASPNPALRNNPFPSVDGGGNVLQQATVALDLHYILTYYGNEERYEPEQLLALATIALTKMPQLTNDWIARTIAGAAGAGLAGSDLATQQERIRVTPLAMSIDELHRVWNLFSPTPYRLSTVYSASAILLSVGDPATQALPVRTTRITSMAAPPMKIIDWNPKRFRFLVDDSVEIVAKGVDNSTVALLDDVPVATRRTAQGVAATVPNRISAGAVSLRLGIAASDGTAIATSEAVPVVIVPALGSPPILRDLQGNPGVVVWPRPEPLPSQASEVILTSLDHPGRGLSSSETQTFPLAHGLWDWSEKPSDALRRAFMQNGHHLADDARIVALGEELRVRSATQPFPEFALRRNRSALTAFHGLAQDDPEGSVAFAFSSLARGRYLVRLRIDGVESPLTIVDGAYVGPLLEVS
jgi:hypothetical protein